MTEITPELLKQVKQIDLRTRGLVATLFAGEYRSVFRGQGMEFAEVRAYEHGDDYRSIDWNVSARLGSPYVKTFTEERMYRRGTVRGEVRPSEEEIAAKFRHNAERVLTATETERAIEALLALEEIDDVAEQWEGDAPLVAIAGHSGSFLVHANDAAQTLDEITAFEAHRVAERKVSPPQLSGRYR